jgi:hypothetical protein
MAAVATVETMDGVDNKMAAISRGETVRYGKPPKRLSKPVCFATATVAGLAMQIGFDFEHRWQIVAVAAVLAVFSAAEAMVLAGSVEIHLDGARFITPFRSVAGSWFDVQVVETGKGGVAEVRSAKARTRKVRIQMKQDGPECVHLLQACVIRYGMASGGPIAGFWTWPTAVRATITFALTLGAFLIGFAVHHGMGA